MDGNYSLRRAHKRLPWVVVVGGGDSGLTHLGASLSASLRALPSVSVERVPEPVPAVLLRCRITVIIFFFLNLLSTLF